MALNNARRQLFTQEWVDGLKHIPEAGMAASIQIIRPSTEDEFVPEINDYVTKAPLVLYTGKARVQPIRSANRRDAPGNDTTVQVVRFSVPISFNTVDLRPGADQVVVTSAALNPQLTEFQYVVEEVLDSSNPIEKTFNCSVNQELRLG